MRCQRSPAGSTAGDQHDRSIQTPYVPKKTSHVTCAVALYNKNHQAPDLDPRHSHANGSAAGNISKFPQPSESSFCQRSQPPTSSAHSNGPAYEPMGILCVGSLAASSGRPQDPGFTSCPFSAQPGLTSKAAKSCLLCSTPTSLTLLCDSSGLLLVLFIHTLPQPEPPYVIPRFLESLPLSTSFYLTPLLIRPGRRPPAWRSHCSTGHR